MIRVGVNGRSLSKPEPTGVSRYTQNIVEALDRRGDVELVLLGVDERPEGVSSEVDLLSRGAAPHSGLRAHFWEQFILPWTASQIDIDVLYVPSGNPPIYAPVPVVGTIHDLSPVRHPEWFSTEYAFLYRLVTPLAIRGTSHIVAISEFTRQEIESLYDTQSPVSVVHNGIPERVEPAEPDDAPATESYFLYVGSTNPRKNLNRLVSAYQTYREGKSDPKSLVLVGPDKDVHGRTTLRSVSGVRRMGYVSDAELEWLYQNAVGFVYPSLYEGFGMPILESMRAGTPVLTSGNGATEEVADDAAVLVDPTDTAAIAQGLTEVIKRRSELIDAGRERTQMFSWDRAAEQYVEVFHQAASSEGAK